MIYLSQVLKAQVKDSSETIVGRLTDILIKPQPGEYAPLCFLLVENKLEHKKKFIPFDFVANLSGSGITLKHLENRIPESDPGKDYVPLAQDILDEQIVDVKGARIVRVNDLKLGPLENKMCVIGIDISFKGILRRLGLSWIDIFNTLKVNLIDWREAHMVEGALQLATLSEDLKRLHPADLANIIEELTVKQGSNLVDSLESSTAAQVVEEMDPTAQKTIMHYLGPERAADIVEKMSIDETVDLLQMLPKEDAKQFLSSLRGSKFKKIQSLIKYEDDTAGGLMTTEYAEADPEWTVEQVTEEIRRLSPSLHSLLYVYVVGKDDNLLGSVSLRTLIVSEPKTLVRKILKSLPETSVLKVDQKVDEIIRVMTKYNLYSAAVLDENKKMCGVVTLDDVMRYVAPNA